MQFSVENKRQTFLRVIFRRQIAFVLGTIRRDTFAWIVNPAHDVVEVCFFTYALQVRGKMSADLVVAFADRVTSESATTFEQRLAVLSVTFLLLWKF